jgi:DNA polymerase III epsilon subunit-like protein
MSVIVFDLETTGLPVMKSRSEYYDYKMLDKYDNSRVVQIAYSCVDLNYNVVYSRDYMIKGVNLNGSEKFHGITEDILKKEGYVFDDIVNNMYYDFMKCDILIAHNAKFDYNVLLSELYRRGYVDFVLMLMNKDLICSMNGFKNIINKKNAWGGVKYPSLTELSKFVFGDDYEIENAHNAYYDVKALVDSLHVYKDVTGFDLVKNTKMS